MTSGSATFRCRLGKHKWTCSGRGDALTYRCAVCGKTRDTPPTRSGGAEAPLPPGGG